MMLDEFMKGTTVEKKSSRKRCLEKLDAMNLSVDILLKKEDMFTS